jgi:ABC-type uncharacterized transport system involved in gliding motility auxiliary subunit
MTNSTRSLISTIAGFCALGFTLMALIYWAAFSTPPFSFASIDLALRVLVIAAIVSLAVYLLFSPESVGQAASKRSTRLTANAFVASLIAVGIAIAINMIIAGVPAARADLTAGQDFSLSPQTKKVLQDLGTRNANVTAFVFEDPQNPQGRQTAEDLLKEYNAQTPRLKYRFVDPNQEPARAQQFGVRRYGVVVFEEGTKHETAESSSEVEFTSALIRLSQTKVNKVAFLTGHGERDMNGLDQQGYSQARQSLEQNNYQTLSWSLITSPTLSLDQVDVLVVAAPSQAIPAAQISAIQSYLDAGGHAMLMLDPAMPPPALDALRPLLARYGVTPNQGFAVDIPKRFSQQDPTNIFVDTFPQNAITDEIARNRLVTGFSLSMGLSMTPTVTTYTVSPIIQTSGSQPASWLETDIESQLLQFDGGKDVPGPINLALSVAPVSATGTETETVQVKTRLVVFGDADFASNVLLSPQLGFSNLDLFGNTVSWLAGADELVSIRPKDPSTPRTITLDATQKNLVLLTAVFGLPLLVFLFGIINWMRRR